MHRYILLFALPVFVGCGGPCGDCTAVSGTYDEQMAVTNVKESSCNTIYSNGSKNRVVVKQSGSKITVLFGKDAFPGVLNADDSLQVDEFDGVAKSDNGGSDTPLSILLSGVFSGEKGKRTFDGVYQATAKTYDCVTRIQTHWVEVVR